MKKLYRRWIHHRERRLTLVDTNRRVLPFDWGLEWVGANHQPGREPLEILKELSSRAVRHSSDFFRIPPWTDYRLEEDCLTFPSPPPDLPDFNSQVCCRIFPAVNSLRAVVVIPQWNADASSHVSLCRTLQRLGITALRITLPCHEQRLPTGMTRADHMVSPNVGRTLAITRQAVLEVRMAARWLTENGYRHVGLVGTSIGSCVGYLAFVHDPRFETGVFNHVSAYFAEVVWTGLSTRYVRWGLEEHISLEDLKLCWAPISPASFIHLLQGDSRRHLLITAKFDLTFLPALSETVFREYERNGIAYDRAVLPCGHYTTARFPFKYMDGWYICRYLSRCLGNSSRKG